MKESLFVSIIIPCYNIEQYLGRCLEAIISQDFDDYEVILVDDGSTDSTSSLCDYWKQKSDRISVIHKENGGISSARNEALQYAKGNYILFLDGDDYLEKNALRILFQSATNEELDILYFGILYEQSKGFFIPTRDIDVETISNSEEKYIRSLSFIFPTPFNKGKLFFLSVWHCLVNRELIMNNQIKFFPERQYASEDLLFQIQINLAANRIKYIPDLLYYYCYNKMSVSRTVKLGVFDSISNLREKIILLSPDDITFHKAIDYYYFIRIVDSLSNLVESHKYSFSQKIKTIMRISETITWDTSSVLSMPELNYWKIRMVIKGLIYHKPFMAYTGMIMLKYINKKYLFNKFVH